MTKRLLIVQGHPDRGTEHFNHALAEVHADGARRNGHELRHIDVATLDFPILRSKAEWEGGAVPAGLLQAQQDIAWAEHLVFFFPLWLGGMPALLKGFLEQVARPGFALSRPGASGLPEKLLKGRSARLVVTMGMPALVYRWYFRAHSIKALERNILGFIGIAPVSETLVGEIENMNPEHHVAWLKKLRELGSKAA